MATNELLRFANGEAANVVTFQDWLGRSEVTNGFVAGIARSAHMNRIFSQGALASWVMGQLIVSQLDQDAKLEDQDFYTKFLSALVKYVPENIADGSINGSKIVDASLNAAKIVDATITAAKLANKTISTAKIADLAITAAQIASKTITQAQIADATLTFAKIATEAIATSAEAKAGSVNNKLMTPQLVAQAIAEQLPPSIPTGMLLPFAGTEVPEGFLLCNGANISRTDYAALFAAIGTKWGEGDGSTTFTLPNFNDRFIEGTTDTEKVGQYLEAGAPNISGEFDISNTVGSYAKMYNATGAMYEAQTKSRGTFQMAVGNFSTSVFGFDAIKDNQLFSKSTIQPQSGYTLIIIKT